jgi:hypothetical protein
MHDIIYRSAYLGEFVMQMLVMDFEYNVSEEEFAKVNNTEAAAEIAKVPGLEWKYWLHSPERKECLGVYHFTDKASAQAYIDSHWVKEFSSIPGYTVRSVKLYDLIEENSKICRAPGVS